MSDSLLTGCLIRTAAGAGPAIVVRGGSNNFITANHVTGRVDISPEIGRVDGNFVR